MVKTGFGDLAKNDLLFILCIECLLDVNAEDHDLFEKEIAIHHDLTSKSFPGLFKLTYYEIEWITSKTNPG